MIPALPNPRNQGLDTFRLGPQRAVTIVATRVDAGSRSNLLLSPTSDLIAIDGAMPRSFVLLQAASGSTITVKHGTGNIYLNGLADFSLTGDKTLLLYYDGTNFSDVGAGGGGGGGGGGGSITVQESDGTPSVAGVTTIKVSNGTLTDDGSGVVTIETGAAVSDVLAKDYIHIEDQKSSGTQGGTFTSGSWQTRDLNTKVIDTNNNASITKLAFSSGGTYTVAIGDIIVGATSGATANVFDVELTSGSWAGGDAAGNLWLNAQTGTFSAENLNVGSNSNVATSAGASTNNQVRLKAGTYRFDGHAPVYRVDTHKTRWYNITDSTTVLVGQNLYTRPDIDMAGNVSRTVGRFTITSSKTFEFQHRCVSSYATIGLGVASAFSEVEVYAVVQIWREDTFAGGGVLAEVKAVIYDQTLTSNGAFDITIPAGFDHIEVYALLRSTNAGSRDNVYVFFNSDTTVTNYRSQQILGDSGTSQFGAFNLPFIGIVSAASDVAGEYYSIEAKLPEYTGSKRKNILARVGGLQTTSAVQAGIINVNWASTAAVTSIQLRTDNHPTDVFAVGSRVQVFGVGQRAVGGGGTSTTRGIYADRPASPRVGNVYLVTDAPYTLYYDGSEWRPRHQEYEMTLPDTTGYSWTNQGSATDTLNAALTLYTPGNAAGNNVRVFTKTAPSTPYTVTVAFRATPLHLTSNSSIGIGGGICFRQSSDGKLITFYPENVSDTTSSQNFLLVRRWTNPTTFSAESVALDFGSTPSRDLIWLRATDNGTNRICSYSMDGFNWVAYHTEARTTFLTADQIGFMMRADGSASVAVYLQIVHYEET